MDHIFKLFFHEVHIYIAAIDSPMVRCSNQDCHLGSWFHIVCVGLAENEIPGPSDDWWCSDECRSTRRSTLCKCKTIKPVQMATCALGDACDQGIKFHLDCVNLTNIPGDYLLIRTAYCGMPYRVRALIICALNVMCMPILVMSVLTSGIQHMMAFEIVNMYWFSMHMYLYMLHIHYGFTENDWYCSKECHELGGHEQDYIENYSIAVTWCGLLDLAHRDVIREADGYAMMTMWRHNMTRFWNGNHYKYLIIGHRLLAGEEYFPGNRF